MTATTRRGRFFDGRSSVGQTVSTWIEPGDLVIALVGEDGAEPEAHTLEGAPRVQRHRLQALKLAERWQRGPYPVGLPDGGTLWLEDEDAGLEEFVGALVRGSGARQPVARLWRSWPAVFVCLVLLVEVVIWIDRQGAGLAARAILPLVPLKVDQVVGERAWSSLESTALAPSARTDDEAELRRRFQAMAQACGQGRTYRLELRRMKSEPGFNAFALPNGTLVILDGMLDRLTQDEALAVLGHEIGHVVHRHTMSHIMKSIGLVAVAGTVFSDFSSVLATLVGSVQFLRHSREAERQADAHARECLARAGIDPRVLVGVWTKMREEMRQQGAGEPPGWLSTHPGLEERLRAAQQP